MKSIWVYQYSSNEYNQEGAYTTRYWTEKPSLCQFINDVTGSKLEELNENDILTYVSLYKDGRTKAGYYTMFFKECKNGVIEI